MKIGVKRKKILEFDFVNEANNAGSPLPCLNVKHDSSSNIESSANQEIYPSEFTPGLLSCDEQEKQLVFEQIALDLLNKGFSIKQHALSKDITDALHHHMVNMPDNKFNEASIGRSLDNHQNTAVRNDQIAWINGDSPAGKRWLAWADELKVYLNRRLFLGLFSFESHFAHYSPGHFYKRHVDAFKGETNRVLSLVTYLNPSWQKSDGGELVIYEQVGNATGIKVLPEYGTVCVFLSEEFEHEVKPAKKDRYSIAGWFRVNTSSADRVDPPR